VICNILNTVGSLSLIIFTIDPVDKVLKYVPKSIVGWYEISLIESEVVVKLKSSPVSNLKYPLPGSVDVVVPVLNLHNARFPSIPEVPLVPEEPDVPELPLVPEEPDVPELPLVPDEPEDPSPPAAPAKLTSQVEYVPEPTPSPVAITTKAPVLGS
jgi:hypothetical protein